MRTLAAFAILLAAGSAHADRLQTGGIPLSENKAIVGANIAAGFGNKAQQQTIGHQAGAVGGHPLVSTDTQVATNVAAGINNQAQQQTVGFQGAPPSVALDFSGRGPLVSTRVGVATNVAAGINNHAAQGFSAQQR